MWLPKSTGTESNNLPERPVSDAVAVFFSSTARTRPARMIGGESERNLALIKWRQHCIYPATWRLTRLYSFTSTNIATNDLGLLTTFT
jgi:hypothetical protein